MSSYKKQPIRTLTALASALIASVVLAGCGDGGSTSTAGVGGTGIDTGVGGTGIVVGRISGFGSVFINDKPYNTPVGTTFIVDGVAGSQDDLAVGMVVLIEAETENGEFTGDAISVIYDDALEGPIDASFGIIENLEGTQKTFKVFGETIVIDDTDTRFEATSYADIAVNDIVEISGFRTSMPDAIVATYAKKTGFLANGSKVELRGTIANYDPGPPSETFEIGGIAIEVDPGAEVDVEGGMLQNGLFVEVEGEIDSTAPLVILAMKIESEDEDLGENVDEVRLEGIISGYDTGPPESFEIAGQAVDASGARIEPTGAVLAEGIEVEVEGEIVGGILIADEIEVEEEESELRSYIGTVEEFNNRFTVEFPFTTGLSTEVVVNIDAQTAFEDETGALVTPPFSIDDLVGGGYGSMSADYVIVKGEEVGGEIVATLVKRVNAEDKLELEGIVDAYTAGAGGSITVLGIEYGLDMDTEYEPDPPVIEIGDFVEIEDEDEPPGDPADGVADEVEEEDD